MDELNLLLLICGIALFSLFSGPISRGHITPPMAFVGIGLLFSPIGLGLINLSDENEVIHVIAEVTLILVLFTDATRINLKELWSDHDLPMCLLLLGMPLTILAGTVVSLWILPELLLIEAIILAIILAPTDAALGQAVVSSPKVPDRIRQTLNIESGLNDGIALPALLFAISFAGSAHGGEQDTNWFSFVTLQLTLGPLVGVIVGWLGAKLINIAIDRAYLSREFCNIYLLSLPFIAYLAADQVGGNGFIAAFIAGVAAGNTLKHANEEFFEFSESEGQLLNLVIFFLFGVSLLPQVWNQIDSSIVIYALLSLTFIRMIPVSISMIGKHLRWESILFISWFGPRGLASILFTLLVLEHANLVNDSLVFNTVIVTVALSILLHGITSLLGVNTYAMVLKICEDRGDDLTSENQEVSDMPLRLPPTQSNDEDKTS